MAHIISEEDMSNILQSTIYEYLEYVGNSKLTELVLKEGKISKDKIIKNWESIEKIINDEKERENKKERKIVLDTLRYMLYRISEI